MSLFSIFVQSNDVVQLYKYVCNYLIAKYPLEFKFESGTFFVIGRGTEAVSIVNTENDYSFSSSIKTEANKWMRSSSYTRLFDLVFTLAKLYGKDEDWMYESTYFHRMEKMITNYGDRPTLAYFVYKYNQNNNHTNRIKQKTFKDLGYTSWGWRDVTVNSDDGWSSNDYRILWNEITGTTNHINSYKLTIKGKLTTSPHEVGTAPLEVLQYSSKVEQYIPVDTNKKETLFGIELELENVNQTNLNIIHKHLKKHAIMKRDGSLSNGVEIVSIPSTIEHHKQVYKPFFDDKHSLEAKTNCGIHIHVSRKSMSFLAIGRMLKFMHKNKALIEKIAGRSNNSYCRINDWDLTSPWYSVNGDKYQKVPRFQWDKYTGINIQPNNTAEFRIFKSTTKWEEFCRFLEFTESFVNYHHLAGNDNHGKIRKIDDMMDFENYKAFVAERASVYPYLNKFIQSI